MGIKDLNKLFERCEQEPRNKYYRTIIYDGYNVLFQTLHSELSKLKKSGFLVTAWESLNMDMMTQIVSLVQNSVKTIVDLVTDQFNHDELRQVFFVIDGAEEPTYKITNQMKMNVKYLDTVDEELKNGVTIEINIKADEQKNRKAATDKSETMARQIGFINNYSELSEEEKSDLVHIFMQSYAFNNTNNLIGLSDYIIKCIIDRLKEYKFSVINSIDEADLVIKNIAVGECEPTEPILIVSADTDYNVLFADMPNVDTTSLMKRGIVYNPHKCWQTIFKNFENICDYEHIIRLAPLFGNDYTAKESILSAVNCEDALTFMNGQIKRLQGGRKAKKITKIVNGVLAEKYNHQLTLDEIDDIIYEWNEDYFRRFYLSTVIYANWECFNRFNVMPKPTADVFSDSIEHMLTGLFNSYMTTYKALNGGKQEFKLITWKPELLFTDWAEFFKHIECINVDSAQVFVDYFYEDYYAKIYDEPEDEFGSFYVEEGNDKD